MGLCGHLAVGSDLEARTADLSEPERNLLYIEAANYHYYYFRGSKTSRKLSPGVGASLSFPRRAHSAHENALNRSPFCCPKRAHSQPHRLDSDDSFSVPRQQLTSRTLWHLPLHPTPRPLVLFGPLGFKLSARQ